MTPEREAYLAKCSEKELFLRQEIKRIKSKIKNRKRALNEGDVLSRILRLTDKDHFYGIYYSKLELATCRHELARLKGMDRVVVPSDAYTREYLGTGICTCGYELNKKEHNYCPTCGRRVLWKG